ncbi:GNAT family N-acetyltransferase [Domibacillus indicus]|uniref:GNAT family N-acetyltransferase n=1 Tax=Domibacillus indicus TaxID=1437523 RepID=UPI000617B3F6|nr:GNAT family N-acetyltransferase [Domibacillus indicus]
MKDFLHTERLYLRKITEADSRRLFEIWSDPEVTRFMNITNFTKEEQAKEMILLLNKLAAENRAIRFTIIEKKSNLIIGSCGFNVLDRENARAEIGYDLARNFWGKAYASEAVSILEDYAFKELGLVRIEAKVEPENFNSIKVLEKSGFYFEGTLRKSEKVKGRFVDLNMYSKLSTD